MIRDLTPEEIRSIHRVCFITPLDDLPPGLRPHVLNVRDYWRRPGPKLVPVDGGLQIVAYREIRPAFEAVVEFLGLSRNGQRRP